VVGVAGRDSDRGLDLPLQEAVALEVPVRVVRHAVVVGVHRKDQRQDVDVRADLLRHRQRLGENEHRQRKNESQSHYQPPAQPGNQSVSV
jgi:hypothetical protein